jgi:polar amino acid transport system substrate-binding protein
MRFLFIALALVFHSQSYAQEIKIAAVEAQPFSTYEKGPISGLSVEIVRELVKRADLKSIETGVPIFRMNEMAEADRAIFPVVTRNASRESKFKWIGLILEDRQCFATVKPAPPVTTMDEAKKLKALGVVRGGNAESRLSKEGLHNIVSAEGDTGNARKLAAKVIDAWYTSSALAFWALKQEGVDPSRIECSGNLGATPFWIATSKKITDTEFEKLKAAYAEIEKEGMIKKKLEALKN